MLGSFARNADIQLQQELPSWMGGQATVPYEQYTQQSPCFGLSNALQPLQS